MKINVRFNTCTNGETALRGLTMLGESRECDRVAVEASIAADASFIREARKIKGHDFEIDCRSSSWFPDWHGGSWKEGASIIRAYTEDTDADGDLIETDCEVPDDLEKLVENASDVALMEGHKVLEEWADQMEADHAEVAE